MSSLHVRVMSMGMAVVMLPLPIYPSSTLSGRGLEARNDFSEQALSASPTLFLHPPLETPGARCKTIREITRRKFFPFSVSFLTVAKLSPAQTMANGRQQKPLPTLIIPVYARPEGPIPAAIQEKVDRINRELRSFRESAYDFSPGRGRILRKTPDAYWADFTQTYTKIFNGMLSEIWIEQGPQALSASKREEFLRHTSHADASQIADYMSLEFFPYYFASHGYYFEFSNLFSQRHSIPYFDVRPILGPQKGTVHLPALGRDAVRSDQYRLGKPLVELPFTYSTRLPELSRIAFVREGTSQIFIREPESRRVVDNSVSRLMAIRASLIQGPGQYHRMDPKSDYHFIEKLHWNMQVTALEESVGPEWTTWNRDRLSSTVASHFDRWIRYHEHVHVHDNQSPNGLLWARGQSHMSTLVEIRAEAGLNHSGLNLKWALSDVIRQLAASDLEHDRSNHGLDYVFILNRVAYHAWAIDRLKNGEVVTVDRFEALEQSVQRAVLEQLPFRSPEDFDALYDEVWNEIQEPDLKRNIFINGIDCTLPGWLKTSLLESRAGVRASNVASPAMQDSPLWPKAVGLSAAAAGATWTFWKWWMNRTDQVAQAEKPKPVNATRNISKRGSRKGANRIRSNA